MKRIRFVLTLGLLLGVALTGCRGADVLSASDAPSRTPATADAVPAGTALDLRLNERLGTGVSDVGDTFTASVASGVTAETGRVAIPAGATVFGTVTGIDPSDEIGDQAAIRLAFDRIEVRGERYPFAAEIVEAGVEAERDDEIVGEETAIGAAAGAALGLVLGGDLLDALAGGVLGAGAGTAISLGTGDVDAVLPAGTSLSVRTERRVDLQ